MGKHLCWSLFFNNIAGHRPWACNFIKKETPTQVFSCDYYEIFKKFFFMEHLRWLLLKARENLKLDTIKLFHVNGFLSIPPENTRKALVFWCFWGVKKETSGKKWVKTLHNLLKNFP